MTDDTEHPHGLFSTTVAAAAALARPEGDTPRQSDLHGQLNHALFWSGIFPHEVGYLVFLLRRIRPGGVYGYAKDDGTLLKLHAIPTAC